MSPNVCFACCLILISLTGLFTSINPISPSLSASLSSLSRAAEDQSVSESVIAVFSLELTNFLILLADVLVFSFLSSPAKIELSLEAVNSLRVCNFMMPVKVCRG